MTKDFHGCGVLRAGRNVVPWDKPVITARTAPVAKRGNMTDDELHCQVAAELSWDPQLDNEAIEVRISSSASAGIINHHLPRPHSLQNVSVTLVQRGEVLPDRIRMTCGTSLPAR
jgi:hypothetical protein